jgi:hypothetical protein
MSSITLIPSNLDMIQPNRFCISERCSCIVNNELSFSHYYSRNIVSNLPLMDHTYSRILLEAFGGETTELVQRPIGDRVQT